MNTADYEVRKALGRGERGVLMRHIDEEQPAGSSRLLVEWALGVAVGIIICRPALALLERRRERR